MESQRYVFKLLGDTGRVVASRYHLSFQAISRLAAIVVPDAVMLRFVRETGGNLAGVLGPIETALKDQGFTHFMVVPADVRVVELIPTTPGQGSAVDALHAQLQETAQVLREVLLALTGKPDTEAIQHHIAVQLTRLG